MDIHLTNELRIRETALRLGADDFGVGSISRFQDFPAGRSPLDLWSGCRSVLAFGIAIPSGLLDVEPDLLYWRFNRLLIDKTDLLALELARSVEREFHCKALPIPCDGPVAAWDPDTKTAVGMVPMKELAVACGLGSIGKSTLLISPSFGTRLTIGAVMTDLDLPSSPVLGDLCIPGCTLCMDACPAHAIAGGHVTQLLCREQAYIQNDRGEPVVHCNRCRAVCPRRNGVG